MSSTDWAVAGTAIASAVGGISAAVSASLSVRLQRRWGSADAFIRISEQFESPVFRKYKTLIYELDRSTFQSWSSEETASVNAWCAHLDLVSVLVQSQQISKSAFLNLYGDVVLRTIYQVAPYCNHQLSIRGKQFLLPLRLLTGDLIKAWRKSAASHQYPITIGFPAQPQLRVNPDLFDSDDAVLAFRVDRRIR